ESETFCFDLEEISSGSISLPDYEAFYDDHVKETSSGSTTTHYDCSLYDSFIFDFRSIHFLMPIGMKIPFLIPASPVIISLLSCRMYLIRVELS
nr:hypothetical protein [Tanacetum cinerariifolium]